MNTMPNKFTRNEGFFKYGVFETFECFNLDCHARVILSTPMVTTLPGPTSYMFTKCLTFIGHVNSNN